MNILKENKAKYGLKIEEAMDRIIEVATKGGNISEITIKEMEKMIK